MKYLSTVLELAGAGLVIYAVWSVAPAVAIALVGLVLVGTGYGLGRAE